MHRRKRIAAFAPGLVAIVTPLALLAACNERGERLGILDTVPPPRFGAPQRVGALSSPVADEDPTFTEDLRELFFMSRRNGTADIWTSSRAAATEQWGPPVLVAELSSPADDWAPAIAPNGRTIWFTTDRDGGAEQIWYALRAAPGMAWGAPHAVPELAGGFADRDPAVDDTERTLYFSSNRAGDGGFDLYVATRPALNASWEAPAPVPGINTADKELDPFVAGGGLLLFFARTGPTEEGDIYLSTRGSTTAPWSPAVPLDSINSKSYDSDPSVSVDLSYMMFSSKRTGNGEIYEARALP